MKNLKSIALALVVAFATVSVSAQTKKIDAAKSSINWLGKKVTGQHNGTVNFKDGALVFKGKKSCWWKLYSRHDFFNCY